MQTTRCFLAVILLMCVGLARNTSIHAKITDDVRTFDFEKTTVADALQQIMKVTGVKIHINKPLNKAIVGKSYLEADLEYILRDLFWQENVAIEWRYGQRGLDTVFITIYEKQKDERPISPSTRPFNYGSNVAGNLPANSNSQVSVWGKETIQRENNQVIDNRDGQRPSSAIIAKGWQISAANNPDQIANYQMNSGSKVQNPTPISENSKASVPIPAPPVKHGLETPPMPPGFLSRR